MMDQVELTACRLLALAFTDCGASTRAQKAWCWLMYRRGVIRQAHQSPFPPNCGLTAKKWWKTSGYIQLPLAVFQPLAVSVNQAEEFYLK